MVVLVAWLVAVVVALLTCAALALGLAGHVHRFTNTLRAAQEATVPALKALAASLPHRPTTPTEP